MKRFRTYLTERDGMRDIEPDLEVFEINLAMIDIGLDEVEEDPIHDILNRRRDRILARFKAKHIANDGGVQKRHYKGPDWKRSI